MMRNRLGTGAYNDNFNGINVRTNVLQIIMPYHSISGSISASIDHLVAILVCLCNRRASTANYRAAQ